MEIAKGRTNSIILVHLLRSTRLYIFFYNPGNPDIPEETRLASKYTSVEGILEGRFFYFILIDGDQRNSNLDPY